MASRKNNKEKLTKQEQDKIWAMVKIQHEIEMELSYLPIDERGNVEQGDVDELKERLGIKQ